LGALAGAGTEVGAESPALPNSPNRLTKSIDIPDVDAADST
jgi:hypothetical protein